jgi:hypothetical protein
VHTIHTPPGPGLCIYRYCKYHRTVNTYQVSFKTSVLGPDTYPDPAPFA